MSYADDMIGKTYGLWTVLESADPVNCHKMVHCRCACGRERDVNASNLRRGVTLSCGCTGAAKRRDVPSGKHIDLTGQRFGRLVAISFIRKDLWLWQCDCGKTKRIRASSVKDGITRSCGCLLSETATVKVTEQNILEHFDGTQVVKLRTAMADKARPRPGNTTGHVGVRERVYPNGSVRYQARLMLRGKDITLGTFRTIEEAVAARKEGEKKYYAPVIDDFDSLK